MRHTVREETHIGRPQMTRGAVRLPECGGLWAAPLTEAGVEARELE